MPQIAHVARRLLVASLMAVPLGCPPASVDPVSEGSSTLHPGMGTSTAVTTGALTGETSTTGSTTGPATTGGPTTEAFGTTEATTGSPPPKSVCDPQPEDVFANFVIDGEVGWSALEYTHHCVVTALSQDVYLLIELSDCKSDPDDAMEDPVTHIVEAEMGPSAPIDLEVGEEVALAHLVVNSWFRNQAFTIRRPSSEIVLAGLMGPDLAGMSEGPPAEFFTPFTMSSLEVCPYEPLPPMEETNFITDGHCYQRRRDALRMTWSGGATVDVIDRSSEQWPDRPYLVTVFAAEYYMDLGQCSDVTDRWFQLMILRSLP